MERQKEQTAWESNPLAICCRSLNVCFLVDPQAEAETDREHTTGHSGTPPPPPHARSLAGSCDPVLWPVNCQGLSLWQWVTQTGDREGWRESLLSSSPMSASISLKLPFTRPPLLNEVLWTCPVAAACCAWIPWFIRLIIHNAGYRWLHFDAW